MRKMKIYLDTSVISHLKQDDVPEKMQDTLTLWEDMKSDLYEVVISDVTIDEIHEIRYKDYEKIKSLTNDEIIKKTKEAAKSGWGKIDELRKLKNKTV